MENNKEKASRILVLHTCLHRNEPNEVTSVLHSESLKVNENPIYSQGLLEQQIRFISSQSTH